MGLTSLLLTILVALGTVAVLAGLVLLWRRLRGPLLPVRIVGILLAESLLLVAVGLTINRAGDFYPNWASLLGETTPVRLPATESVHLTPQLAAQASAGRENGLVFPWHPAGERDWRLAGSPVAYLPPESFQPAGAAVPAIVVVSTAPLPAANAVSELAKLVGEPVAVVFVRLAKTTAIPVLATGLARELPASLPVLGHGWVLAGSGPAALSLWQAAQQRFVALALTSPTDGVTVHKARFAVRTRLWVGPDLSSALRWAGTQTPPPLAPPVALTPLSPSPTARPGVHAGHAS
ncbi:MAG: hypothetical protein HOU81_15325 [Hamadaea sp.]|uniref:hypothetical protein n=1 Tax=Hamadaea sp. TaxID=2024425 RepID=UPI00185E42A0|nr:hypothetical protein [Hamadaea sp.]NUR72183.1 hypothetical protein [Hamadaea sp.]NUT18600.1 hypothetical protein [Hamadaea sp.]